MASDTPLTLNVVNPATAQPVVYIGVPATLNVQLVNGTGQNLSIPDGSTATLTLYFPDFYSVSDIASMTVDLTAMPGWTHAASDASLVLTHVGDQQTWPAGHMLAFTLGNVATSATTAETNQSFQVNPAGIANLPLQVECTFALIAAPVQGSVPLTDVLSLSLDNQGVVFVSTVADPLANQLTLTVTNIGAAPLYNDSANPRPASPVPQMVVSFVYGGTSGALLPDSDRSGALGSAWNIQAAVGDASGGAWGVTPPATTDASPSWTLAPLATNPGVLGIDAQRSVSFDFTNIVSFLTAGVTQMIVHCSNFTQSALKTYDDAIFFLPVVKQYPPPTRGLISFYSTAPIQSVNRSGETITIPLSWAAAQTDKVVLLSDQAGAVAQTFDYTSPPPALHYDSTRLTLPGVTRTTTLLLTLQALDGAGRFLNSLQFAAYIQANMFTDPVDGAVYPAVKIGTRFWMAADLARVTTSGSFPFGINQSRRAYTPAAGALPGDSDGWRLPTQADYNALVALYGTPQAAYAALMPSGGSGFAAAVGGWCDNNGSFNSTDSAFYWSSSQDPSSGQQIYASFSASSQSLLTTGSFPTDFAMPVRYVKDAA